MPVIGSCRIRCLSPIGGQRASGSLGSMRRPFAAFYRLIFGSDTNPALRPILGVKLPLISIDAMAASAPSKVALALDRMGLPLK